MQTLAAFEESEALVMLLDPQARICYINRACEALTECPAGKAVGKSIRELGLVPDETGESFGKSAPAADGVWPTREMLCRPMSGGPSRWIAWYTTPMFDQQRHLAHVLALGAEITPYKRAEELLRQRHNHAEEAYQRERRIATRLQGALLPYDVSGVPGYAIAHTYRPALGEADICGDFYSIFQIDQRRLGLLAGDVGGKGLDAAGIAARVRCSAVALAVGEHDPGDIIQVLHRIACLEDPDRVTTLFMGILEPATGRLWYSGAGHEPALLLRSATRSIDPLPSEGAAICGMTSGPYPTREVRLECGDTLLLYTDGLPEARAGRGSEPMGCARIAQLLAEYPGKEPAAIVEAITHAAVEHSRGRLADDIAVVVVRRLAEHHPGSGTVFVKPPLMDARLSFRTGSA